MAKRFKVDIKKINAFAKAWQKLLVNKAERGFDPLARVLSSKPTQTPIPVLT